MRIPKLQTLFNRQDNVDSQLDMDKLRFYATHRIVLDHTKDEWSNQVTDIDDEINRLQMACDAHIHDLYTLQEAICNKMSDKDAGKALGKCK
jgi:hypothetical protein